MRFFSTSVHALLLSLMSSLSHAINPPDGIYGGILLGGSITNNLTINTPNLVINNSSVAEIKHSPFGDLAFDLGYRWCANWRAEVELLINYNPYNSVEIGGYSFPKKYKYNPSITYTGQTTTGAFMLNGFYDLFTPGSTSNWAPYVGIGIGYSRTQNKLSFYTFGNAIPGLSYSETATSPAAQGIIGLGYFLDDYSAVGLDFRYLTTKKTPSSDQRLNVVTINLSFVGSFS